MGVSSLKLLVVRITEVGGIGPHPLTAQRAAQVKSRRSTATLISSRVDHYQKAAVVIDLFPSLVVLSLKLLMRKK